MDIISMFGWFLLIIFLIFILGTGFRKVHQTQRGLIERFGKYKKYAEPGLHWIIPVIYI